MRESFHWKPGRRPIVRRALTCAALAGLLAPAASAQEVPVLTLVREHRGADCVVGPVVSEGDLLAWAVEKPWQDRRTLWGALLPGTFRATATYRGASDIALHFRDLPGQPVSILMLGPHSEDGMGRIAIGPKLTDSCSVAPDQGYSHAVERLAKVMFGTTTPHEGASAELRVRVEDR